MGIDAALSDTAQTSSTYSAKVTFAGMTGWMDINDVEITPLIWTKAASSYTVSSTEIRHNYVNRPQFAYSGSAGRVIGPKPTMLAKGTYYSYDGHYFYKNLKSMLTDYKANTTKNAVNAKEPYYNYYMYLSNHTKTNYSAINIDEYIRKSYTRNVYGKSAESKTSRLYGSGTFFYNAQQVNGVNALLSYSLSRNEIGNGTSSLAINKNNGFGLNAVDSNPYQAANWYPSFASSIMGYARDWITAKYAKATKDSFKSCFL
jgi:beta-N-acetylglucosaminidase